MSGVKRDGTLQLPDEILCHVFSFLTLAQKLKSEAVNHKFQRCVMKELRDKPGQLELDLWSCELNEYKVPPEQIFGAVRTLAKKAKFSSISVSISFGSSIERMEEMDRILSALTADKQCLTKVTSFKSNTSCSQDVLEIFLNKCDKLVIIKFDFVFCPFESGHDYYTYPLDLAKLFKNRGLTELQFGPYRFPQDGLIDMFRVLKPNSLRKVSLSFDKMRELNVVGLVNALNQNAGSTLRELHLELVAVRVQMADFLESLASKLPALRECEIHCSLLQPANKFVPAVTSLFNMSHINITVRADGSSFCTALPGCQVLNMIRQIQTVHPGMEIDFDATGGMNLTLGNASILKKIATRHCCAHNCLQCQSFYPLVRMFLHIRANHLVVTQNWVTQRFSTFYLDRCRVAQIVDHLNTLSSVYWNALSAEHNQDEQSVTINFESKQDGPHLFSITISCGPCLTYGCIKCVN